MKVLYFSISERFEVILTHNNIPYHIIGNGKYAYFALSRVWTYAEIFKFETLENLISHYRVLIKTQDYDYISITYGYLRKAKQLPKRQFLSEPKDNALKVSIRLPNSNKREICKVFT